MLDFDDPEDPAHGQQEQVRYDGYDGGYCFLPLHVYAGLSGRLIPTLFKAKRFSAAQLHLSGPLEACTERLAAQEEAGINMHSVRVEASDAKTAGKLYAKLVG